MADTGSTPAGRDTDRIESKLAAHTGMGVDPVLGRSPQVASLGAPDGLERILRARSARLHFHERDHVAISSHDVQLAMTGAPIAIEDL